RDDSPCTALQAKETCQLSRRPCGHTQRIEERREVRLAVRVHFMITVQSEASASAMLPLDAGQAVARRPKTVLGDLRLVTHVVDIAKMDRQVRVLCKHQVGDRL